MFQKTTMAAAVAISTSLLLVACGSGNGDNNGAVVNSGPTTGALLGGSSAPTAAAPVAPAQLQSASSTPLPCGVSVSHIDYTTTGAAGESTTASAAVMIPTGSDPSCSGKRPVVLYAHGTTASKGFNMAAVSNPGGGNAAVGEATLVAAQFAGNGYIVIAPNYAGYDTSTLSYHPYVNYKQQSQEMIDALKAGRTALPTVAATTTVADSGKLFVTGYSEGGYVAMATIKAMDAAHIHVTAAAPMSGPYSLAAYGDAVFYGNTPLGGTLFAPLLTTGYQKAYGNIYTSPSDAYTAAYAPNVETLLDNPTFAGSLLDPNNLPGLFQLAPTGSPLLDALSPKDPKFGFGFSATNYMINTSYRAAYLADAQANPDGAVPSVTASPLPAAAPKNTLRQAFKLNDLRGYIPSMPTLMCGGNQDPTVFFAPNAQLMAGIMGNVAAAGAPVKFALLDVDATSTGKVGFTASPALGAAVTGTMSAASTQLMGAFGASLGAIAAPAAIGTTDGNAAYLAALGSGASSQVAAGAALQTAQGAAAAAAAVGRVYHGSLVPPICTVAARTFFQQY